SAESGVQRVVTEVVDKQLDLGKIGEVARGARDAGIPLLVHFMIGIPGETREEINGTLEHALALHEETGAWPSVQFATPLPGTRLAAMARAARPGASLPVLDGGSGLAARPLSPQTPVDDWGPRFQRRPSIETAEFSLEDLERFKWTFDRRI